MNSWAWENCDAHAAANEHSGEIPRMVALASCCFEPFADGFAYTAVELWLSNYQQHSWKMRPFFQSLR